jgi:hypothetical protein
MPVSAQHIVASADPSQFAHALPSPYPELTPDLNLDCTILLALVSDVSHFTLDPDSQRHPAITRQIGREHNSPLLPHVLYPALCGRKLHTPAAAVARMREIIETIGTAAERARAALLFNAGEPVPDTTARSTETKPKLEEYDPLSKKLLDLWAKHTIHTTPPDLLLPVHIEPDITADNEGLPPFAAEAVNSCTLSALNRAVWLLGWARGWATVTSNRVVARQLETCIEGILGREEEKQRAAGKDRKEGKEEKDAKRKVSLGPLVWALGTARSLVKKERGLRG